MERINKKDFERFLYLKRGYSKGGIKTALKNFSQVLLWFKAHNRRLTTTSIEDFFVDKKNQGYKPNTLANYYTTFRLIEHYKGKKLLGDIKPPKSNREIPHILTEDELLALFHVTRAFGCYQGHSAQCLDGVYQTLIQFLYYTGCRISEAVSLKIKNVLPEYQVHFTETKNGDDRVVYLFPVVYHQVMRLCKNRHAEDYVFCSMTGNHVAIPSFEEDLKWRARKAGIKKRVYPHLFRHTLASHLAVAGVDVRVVQKILGHRDLNSTIYYEQFNKDKQIEAIHSLPLTLLYLDAKSRIKQIKKRLEMYKLNEDTRLDYNLHESTRYGKSGLILELFER